MDAACTQALVAGERRRLIGLLEDQGIARDGARWLRRVSDRTVAAIEAQGTATATELTKVVPELRLKLVMGEGKTWGATVGVSTRVLFLLATEGRIVPRPPARPVAVEPVRVGVAAHLGRPAARSTAPTVARAALAAPLAADLRARATLRDLTWWTGWTQAHGRAALGALDAVEVELDDGTGYVLPDDLAPVRTPTTLGRAAPRTRPDDHGLEGARLVPRPARGPALRPQRQRRSDRVVRRPDRRRLGPAPRTAWSRRSCSSRSTRPWRAAGRTRRPRLTEWLDGTIVTPAVPHPAGARDRGRSLVTAASRSA